MPAQIQIGQFIDLPFRFPQVIFAKIPYPGRRRPANTGRAMALADGQQFYRGGRQP